uniref:N-acyl amino acid synthase FeeM catalytic core domain-containing protein n=1 Tax=Rhodopseudomonas palustris (strain BisA53) TaxID=316055 RepID=Q07HG0_RHOP5
MSSTERTKGAGGPSARAFELLDRVDYRLAESDAEREAIYRLRYRAYLKEGTIEPNRAQMVKDRFDDLGNSWVFGIHFDGVLSSSLRITVASPEQPASPSMDVFGDVLRPELEAGKLIVDPTRFVADPDLRFPELPYMTLRLAFVACARFNADIGLATVRAEHQAFYRKVFLHQPVCAPRPYPGLTKPIALMAVAFQEQRDKVFARYPFLRSTLFERRMLFERTDERQAPPLQPADIPFEGAVRLTEISASGVDSFAHSQIRTRV